MADAEKIRLTAEDWNLLFPTEEHKLGTTVLKINPLGLKQLKLVKDAFEKNADKIQEKKIDQYNYALPQNIIFLAGVIIDEVPEVLSEITKVHIDDLVKIPLEPLAGLIAFIIEMNLKSKEGLEKNFTALGDSLKKLFSGDSVIPSTSSSEQATDGKISETTPKGK